MRRTRRLRGVLALLVGAAVLTGLTGCDLFAPQETLHNGETSDGVSGTTGAIQVANAVLITSNGAAGNLVATLVNTGGDAQEVRIQLGSSSGSTQTQTVKAKAAQATQLGQPGGDIVLFRGVDLAPGSLESMYFQAGNSSGVQLDVPVLTGAQEPYHTLTPEKVSPTAG